MVSCLYISQIKLRFDVAPQQAYTHRGGRALNLSLCRMLGGEWMPGHLHLICKKTQFDEPMAFQLFARSFKLHRRTLPLTTGDVYPKKPYIFRTPALRSLLPYGVATAFLIRYLYILSTILLNDSPTNQKVQ
jgi:hypothetical protein